MKFEVTIGADGRCDVTRDHRAWRYDLADLAEAMQEIRRDRGTGPGTAVWVVHPDGFRERLRV